VAATLPANRAIAHAIYRWQTAGSQELSVVGRRRKEGIMAFGMRDDDDDEVMSQINMTPLVDVMLVLLIIFIITIPVIHQAVKINLPRATDQPNDTKPVSINISIDAQGKMYWNQQAIDDATLDQRIAEAAKQRPRPVLHLRADRDVRYERVARLMAAAQHGGLDKIGFITEPQH